MGIQVGASGSNAQVPFSLFNSATGAPITGYSFTTGEVKVYVPGVALANALIANIVEIGGGVYVLQLTAGQTVTAGLVCVTADVSTALAARVWERVDWHPTSTAIADAVMNYVVENSKTFLHYVRIIKSGVAGLASGFNTPTRTYRDDANTKNRITATVGATGRTAVTVDGT